MIPRRNHALAEHRLTQEEAIARFYDVLLPDPDPASMQVAQDLCEEYGLKLAQLGHAMAVEGFENTRDFNTRGWADSAEYRHRHSIGQFTLSATRIPFLVEMRPPTKGERGWWVSARVPETALVEIMRNADPDDVGAVGWIARFDYEGLPDEHDMIPVTIVPDPDYMAVGWMVWRGAGPAYRIECWATYRGSSWDESSQGPRGIFLKQLPTGRRNAIAGLPKVLEVMGGSSAAIAERRAVDLAWRMAKQMKEHAMVGSDVIDVITSLRESFGASPPPRSIVNPWEVESRDGGVQPFAREEDAEAEADDLRRRGARDVELRRTGQKQTRPPAGNPSGAMTRDQAFLAFKQIIREPTAEAMIVAQDIVLEHQLPLTELSELSNHHGVFVLSPAEPYQPLDQVDWEVEQVASWTAAANVRRWAYGVRYTWNGQESWLQVPHAGGRYMNTEEAARRAGAADAWAVAKAMKQLQVDEVAGGHLYDSVQVRDALDAAYRGAGETTPPEVYTTRAQSKKKRTYLEARDDIWHALIRLRWTMSAANLKTPYATSPNGWLRLWFKPQGVHASTSGYRAGSQATPTSTHTLGNARAIAYDLDIRALTPQQFLDEVKQRYPQAFEGAP